PGITGNFFAPLAETMIVILLISLVLSVTVVPVFATWVFPASIWHGELAKEPPGPSGLQSFYGRVFSALVRRPSVAAFGLLPIALIGWFVFGKLQTGFMPEFDEGAFVLDYHMPAGTSFAETDRVMSQVEGILQETEGVATWSRLTGALSGSGLEICALNQGD